MNGTDGDGTTVVGDALRVLVVGDSAAVETAGDVLAAELVPAAVIRARTLEEARERLEPGTVHCVLCAYPDESGRELLAAIDPAPSDPSTPVVALTADPERALEAGATDAVSPDASAAVLANRVRRVAECARQVDRGSSRPRALLESVDAPVWLLEPDGAVAYASPAVEDRLGYAPTELERASLSRLVHPDDRSALEDGLGTLAGSPLGARERLAVRLGTAAGEWRGAALTLVNRLAAPPLEGIVATAELGSEPAVDVPDALEDLAEPLFVVGPDLALRWANAAAKQLFADGVDPEPGRLVTDVLADDIRDRFARGLHEAATSGAPVSFEVAVPDGEDAVTLAVSATPRQGEGGDGDGSDETPITVLAQERPADGERPGLEDRLAVLESTLDALEDGVAIVRDERIERANRSLVDRLGGADPVGDGLEDLFDDDLAATVRDRARSSLVRWTEPAQGDLLVADASDEGGAGTAESIPVDVYVAPLRDGTDRDRTLCLVRDRRRSAAGALSTVRRTIAAVRDAEAAAGVRRAVLEALRSRTAADLAIWYRLDDERFVPVAVSTDESVPSIEPPAIDPGRLADDERAVLEGAAAEPTAYDRTDVESVLAAAGIDAERVLVVPIAGAGVVLATSPEPLAFEALDRDRDRAAIAAIGDGAAVALESVDRGSQLVDCRRERTALEGELALEAETRRLGRELLAAESRDDLERRLCEGVLELGGKSSTESSNDDGGVDLVWIGEIDPTSERIAPRTVAGGDLPEEFSVAADPDVAGPTGRTAARGTATMADDREGETVLPATESRPQAPQDRDLDSSEERLVRDAGYRSVLSIPLAHDGDAFRYGTLTAYAERPGAFGDRLRDAVGFLATVAAHAVGALERERALLSDGVVELEVAIRTDGEDRDPLAALVRRLGRPVAVHAVVPRSSGGSTVYCTPSGTDSAETLTTGAIETAVDAIPALESFRWVGDGDGSADRRLELEFAEGTAANAVATLGGVLRSVRPGEDRTRLLVALPQPLDVRQFVDALGRTGREATLLARRERDHATRSARPFEAELENRLSERQLRTLESAYYGGFFDWPRESTGEEIAEALGVSQPTFSRHLRVAQGKLFELLFEERSVGEE